MFLDPGDLRAVHACWDAKSLPMLAGKSLTDDGFLRACAANNTPEFRAIEPVLKGPQLPLPVGVTFTDKDNVPRSAIRSRWWGLAEGMNLGEVVMPRPMDVKHPLKARLLRKLPNYAPDAPPVFFEHYWMPADAPKVPPAPNLVCLDFSGALRDNPLHAYRWDGAAEPTAEDFVTSTS